MSGAALQTHLRSSCKRNRLLAHAAATLPLHVHLLSPARQPTLQSRAKSTHSPPTSNQSSASHRHPHHPSDDAVHSAASASSSASVVRRIARNPIVVPSISIGHASPPLHFAAPQPPPHHGAPRLIRYPPPSSAYEDTSAASYGPHSPLYTHTRGPVSRLFSFRNSAASSASSLSSSTSSVATTNASLGNTSRLESLDQASTMVETGAVSSLPRKRWNAKSLEKEDAATKNEKSLHEQHTHEHDHHSHGGWFGHSHSHDHGAEGSAEEADRLLNALKGKGDRGSNITVVGLIANLILCGAKGMAGVWLHSASLLADAAHSLSDTFSDLVTLFCWKMSQKPASPSHPLGYGKFETMGGLGVSVVLVAGAFAIGMHSYSLLLDVLQPHLQHMPSGLQAFGTFTGDLAKAAGGLLHDHHHASGADHAADAIQAAKDKLAGGAVAAEGENLLDPNAMWFALISVLVKEWLYHATLKIAREEKSSVLEANAIHHRSDSLSSGVTFLAIGGSYLGFPVLDPLGGLLVAGLIGKQGIELLISALADLSDRGVQPEVLDDFVKALQEVVDEEDVVASSLTPKDAAEQNAKLLGWKDLRAVRSGVSTFVDVTLIMHEDIRLGNARHVESKVREKLLAAVKGVKEVRIHLDTQV